MNRKQWFMDRIGKTIYRTKGDCDCHVCRGVEQNGLTISDDLHARYLYDCEMELGLRYFDTQAEVIDYENLKNK